MPARSLTDCMYHGTDGVAVGRYSRCPRRTTTGGDGPPGGAAGAPVVAGDDNGNDDGVATEYTGGVDS